MGRRRLAEAALARLNELAADQCAADDVIDRARAGLQARIEHARAASTGPGRQSRTASPTGSCAAT